MARLCNGLKQSSRRIRRNRERFLCSRQPNLHIGMRVKFSQSAPLISRSRFQLLSHAHQLIKKFIVFCGVITEKSGILSQRNGCKSLYELRNVKRLEHRTFHFSNSNLRRTRREWHGSLLGDEGRQDTFGRLRALQMRLLEDRRQKAMECLVATPRPSQQIP